MSKKSLRVKKLLLVVQVVLYLLKVRARDMKQYQEFVLNKLGEIESLASIESTFVMSEIKQTYGVHI